MRKVIKTSTLQVFDQKNLFFEGWAWFKFNNVELTVGMTLKLYISLEKVLKLKVIKFWGLIPTSMKAT